MFIEKALRGDLEGAMHGEGRHRAMLVIISWVHVSTRSSTQCPFQSIHYSGELQVISKLHALVHTSTFR